MKRSAGRPAPPPPRKVPASILILSALAGLLMMAGVLGVSGGEGLPPWLAWLALPEVAWGLLAGGALLEGVALVISLRWLHQSLASLDDDGPAR